MVGMFGFRGNDRIAEYLGECEQGNMSNHTLRSYRTVLRAWEESDQGVAEYLASYAGTVKPSTVNHRRNVLAAYYVWLNEKGYASSNPAKRVRAAKVPTKLQRTLTVDEVARLLDGCMALRLNDWGPPTEGTKFHRARLRAMVSLQVTAGLRVSELLRIQLADVTWPTKFQHGTVTITGKGDKQRRVRLAPVARRDIDHWLEHRGGTLEGPLFCSTGGEKVQPRTYGRQIDEACWWGDLPHVNPHMLRHTFATLALDGGIPVADLQGMLGHSSVTTTMGYVHRQADAPWESVGSHPLGGLDAASGAGTMGVDDNREKEL